MDPALERFRAIRCPEGSRPEIALETGVVGCFTPGGTSVPELGPEPDTAGLGVVGWAAVASAAIALTAVAISWRR
jgi:hypothetical protein